MDASLRNAAVLVACLDESDASDVLDRLGATPAGRIRDAISVLGTVSRAETESVMRAFLQERPRWESPSLPVSREHPAAENRGVELEEGLARRLAESSEQDQSAIPHAAKESSTPFAFLLETEPEVVAPFLVRESPQTVAVVLSFLHRKQAAEVLKRLDFQTQGQVLKRLARLDEIDPASIDVVADELQAWIAQQRDTPLARVKGNGLLRDMLASSGFNGRTALIADLQREANRSATPVSHFEPRDRAANTAGEPSEREAMPERRQSSAAPSRNAEPSSIDLPPPAEIAECQPHRPARALRFENLAHLSDDHLLRTFQAVPRDVLTLALIGADKALIRRITQNIPRREAKRIKRSLRLDGPMRLEDIEMAKRRVAQIAAEIVTREAR